MDGATKYLDGWRQNGVTRKGRDIQNKDLWQMLGELLARRAPYMVLITKVLGHASAEDVQMGRTSLADKLGNDQADALAVAGSFLRSSDWATRVEFSSQILVTKAVQRMMLDIMLARQRARNITHETSSTSSSGTAPTDSEETSSSRSDVSQESAASNRTFLARPRGRSAPAAAE